jgi:hypothetical protein
MIQVSDPSQSKKIKLMIGFGIFFSLFCVLTLGLAIYGYWQIIELLKEMAP